jgi:hypothetical protein
MKYKGSAQVQYRSGHPGLRPALQTVGCYIKIISIGPKPRPLHHPRRMSCRFLYSFARATLYREEGHEWEGDATFPGQQPPAIDLTYDDSQSVEGKNTMEWNPWGAAGELILALTCITAYS